MIFIDTFQGAICQMPRLCSIGSCTDMQSAVDETENGHRYQR